MFYNKDALNDYKADKRKLKYEQVGAVILIAAAYHWGSFELSVIAGLIVATYALIEIQGQLRYLSFMKEKEIGVHDL
jgi:hypothetical protein